MNGRSAPLRHCAAVSCSMNSASGRQERLRWGAHALVIGAGVPGAAALPYLTSAGVGRISVVDNDHVDLTNLQRQIIHTTDNVGRLRERNRRARACCASTLACRWRSSPRRRRCRTRTSSTLAQADAVLDQLRQLRYAPAPSIAPACTTAPLVSEARRCASTARSASSIAARTMHLAMRVLFPPPEPAPEVGMRDHGPLRAAGEHGRHRAGAAEALKLLLTGVGQSSAGQAAADGRCDDDGADHGCSSRARPTAPCASGQC
ncbi:HesA/MoeB/ThiF family protein [Cupriavidus basilensis]